MRELDVNLVTDAVERMCISANLYLPQDVREAIRAAHATEDGAIAREILDSFYEWKPV